MMSGQIYSTFASHSLLSLPLQVQNQAHLKLRYPGILNQLLSQVIIPDQIRKFDHRRELTPFGFNIKLRSSIFPTKYFY